MRYRIFLLLALPAPLLGQTGNCSSPFEAAADPTKTISMHLRSAKLEIHGSDARTVRVTCDTLNERQTRGVKIRLTGNELSVYGGSKNTIALRIEIPAMSNVAIHGQEGQLNFSGITGDKNLNFKAGHLVVAVDRPEDYKIVEARVWAGSVHASPFGGERSGVFRSFHKENPRGRYSLRVFLIAGAIEFR